MTTNREIAEQVAYSLKLTMEEGSYTDWGTITVLDHKANAAIIEAALTAATEAGKAEVEKARRDENEAIEEYLRYIAGLYKPESDGRNTFLIAADWVRSRLSVQQDAGKEGR